MARLGFLGLGIMGYLMARNLLRAGHDVALWSHTADKAAKLASEEKGRECPTPKEVAQHSECAFLCVGDTAMAEEVILGRDGVIAGAQAGMVVVDASTISIRRSRAIAEALESKGMQYLGAPCTGSRPGAEGGNLTFMIGGDKDVFERVKPLFEPMGKQLYYCGGHGMGLAAKLTQNLILSNLMQAFNEGMVLSTKAGVDPELMLEILSNSAARSGLVAYKAPFILDRNFVTNFSVKWMHKDIGLMLEEGQDLDVPLPLTALTQQIFRAAIAEGHGEEDICSTIKVLEDISKVEVRRRQK